MRPVTGDVHVEVVGVAMRRRNAPMLPEAERARERALRLPKLRAVKDFPGAHDTMRRYARFAPAGLRDRTASTSAIAASRSDASLPASQPTIHRSTSLSPGSRAPATYAASARKLSRTSGAFATFFAIMTASVTAGPAAGPHAVRDRRRARLEAVLRLADARVQALHVLNEPARNRAVHRIELQFEQVARTRKVGVHRKQVAHRVMRRKGGRVRQRRAERQTTEKSRNRQVELRRAIRDRPLLRVRKVGMHHVAPPRAAPPVTNPGPFPEPLPHMVAVYHACRWICEEIALMTAPLKINVLSCCS